VILIFVKIKLLQKLFIGFLQYHVEIRIVNIIKLANGDLNVMGIAKQESENVSVMKRRNNHFEL